MSRSEPGSPTSSEGFWEPLHADAPEPAEAPRVNVVLTELLAEHGLSPGRVLDLGAGGGGDTLWFATRGWQVTAVDVSPTAVRRIRTLAALQGTQDHIRGMALDVSRSLPAITVDLVSACYFHSPVEFDRAAVLRQAADLMGIGGTLVVVDHASTAPWSWATPDTQYPSPEQTWAAIGLDEDWTPLTVTARERLATGPHGEQAMVTDNIIVARRTDEQPFSARAEQEVAALRAKPYEESPVSGW